jgi:hypothetical protein
MDYEALRWRVIPWKKIHRKTRVGVLHFLSVKDNAALNIALVVDESRDDYLASHAGINLPAYDNFLYYTDHDNFQGLRWVMKRGIKLNTLRMRVGEEGYTDRDRVMYWLVFKEYGDIAREYARVNTDVEDMQMTFAKSTLMHSCEKGYTEVVKALIANGAYVNASVCGETSIFLAARKGHLEIVQALIAAKADVNKAMTNGRTPIYVASIYNHLGVVNALIAADADVNLADNAGDVPLHWASHEGHLEVVQALLAAGAIRQSL